MRRYPEYKDSDVQWLGEVPSHWEAVSMKRIASVVNGATPRSSQEEYWGGGIVWITPADLGKLKGVVVHSSERKLTEEGVASCGTTLTPADSVVLSTRAPIGHVALTATPSCTNQGCKTLVPDPESSDAKYLYYTVLAGKAFLQALGQGSTFTELPTQALADVRVPLPSHDEQRQLAAYLDRKTGEIDALIRKKQALIALLREQRTSVINRAVTKGLDPDARMKDSGVAWLGEVPEHWQISQLRYLVPDDRGIMYGIVLPGPHYEGGVPIVKASNCLPGRMKLAEMKRTDPAIEERYVRSRLRSGDVVISIRGSYGSPALVPEELEGANLTQDAARVSPKPGVDSK